MLARKAQQALDTGDGHHALSAVHLFGQGAEFRTRLAAADQQLLGGQRRPRWLVLLGDAVLSARLDAVLAQQLAGARVQQPHHS